MMDQPLDSTVAIAFDIGAISPRQSGFSRWAIAKGEKLISHAIVMTEGGELGFHAHFNEEHMFLVVEGEAQFDFANDQESVRLGRLQAILIPSGCYYRYCSVGENHLVLARVGTVRGPDAKRILLDARPLSSDESCQSSVQPLIQAEIS